MVIKSVLLRYVFTIVTHYKKIHHGLKMICWSLDKIKEELDKCDLVCHNCHAEIHYGPQV